MKPILDLDRLHKQHKRQKIKHSILGTLAVLVILTIGVSLLTHKSPTHPATVTGNFTAASSPSSATSTTTTPSSSSVSSLKQEAAEDKALAAQDAAEAKQDVADAQNDQAALDGETPSASVTASTPTISIPPPDAPLPAPTCTGSSGLTSTFNAYIQAEGALNNYESELNQPGAAGYGVDAAQAEAEEQQQLSSLENTANQAQNAYESAEAQLHCS